MSENRCVGCGEIIPEGRWLCPSCEGRYDCTEKEEAVSMVDGHIDTREKTPNRRSTLKALKECATNDCDTCPNGFGNCYSNSTGCMPDIIARQQEEIENLKIENEHLACFLAEAKTNAYREFAEQLKKEAIDCDVSFGYGRECYLEVVPVIVIDKILAEMAKTGGDEE